MGELKYKDDFSSAKKYWKAFWEKEVIDRPLLISTVPKNSSEPVNSPPYLSGIDGDFKKAVELFEKYAGNTCFLYEMIPYLGISFGPDILAYFLKGAEKNIVVDKCTAWIDPFVKNWEEFLPLELDRKNLWYKKYMDFFRYGAEKGDGKFLLEMADFHTHLDWLRAVRGSSDLCMDLVDSPEEIEKRLLQVRKLFPPVYNDIYESGNMKKWGTTGWIPFYYEGKYAVIQCDFICMIGKNMFRKFVLPAIEGEANFLDHCIFHLDGPGALIHLDDLLTIKKIDAIQWVSGAGNGPHIKWMDLLKKIKKGGKSLVVYPEDAEQLKFFHKEFGPEGIVYQIDFKSLEEAEETKNWLVQNT